MPLANFDELELVVIWFAMINEQKNHVPGTQSWAKYEKTIRKIEQLLGPDWVTPRPTLTVIK
jgi:hypothetical protein